MVNSSTPCVGGRSLVTRSMSRMGITVSQHNLSTDSMDDGDMDCSPNNSHNQICVGKSPSVASVVSPYASGAAGANGTHSPRAALFKPPPLTPHSSPNGGRQIAVVSPIPFKCEYSDDE